MKLSIFGTGYVGLVTGTCLAEVGHEVLCVDIDTQKVQNLKSGIIPIYEPGLQELVTRNIKNRRLNFTTDAKTAVEFGEAIFSAVGTPPDANHRADLKYVKAVAKTIGEYMNHEKVFINKSTVPVGTGKICKKIIEQELEKRGKETPTHIVSNPEFLREGTAVKDFMVPDRIVCGINSERAKEIMEKIYEPFSRSYVQMIWTDIASAEIAKYAANAFLATKLSFINEIANFAELAGGNIRDISKAIGSDTRIGNKFLHAGIGYGGSCFPKDVNALIETGKDFGYDFKIIAATEQVNKIQKLKLIEKLQKHIDLQGKTIAVWGLSFKPKTDDMREAPSLAIIEKLCQLGAKKIQVFDPVSLDAAKKILTDESVLFCKSSLEAAKNADALLIVTEWDEFRGVEKEKLLAKMSGNIIIDGRNIWNKQDFINGDVVYEAIGIS